MPMAKWFLKLSEFESKKTYEFDQVSNERNRIILLSLSKLALTTDILFGELLDNCNLFISRCDRLTNRILKINNIISKFNVLDEAEVTVDEALQIQPFKSSHVETNQMRPKSIQKIFIEFARPIPRLHLLNKFNLSEEPIELKYSNSNFFFNVWYGAIQQEVEKIKPSKKKKLEKKAVVIAKKLQNTQLNKMKAKAMNELGISPTIKTIYSTSEENNLPNLVQNDENDEDEPYENMPPPPCNILQPPPHDDSLYTNYNINDDLPIDPPPNILRAPSVASKNKSIYQITDFDRNSMMPLPNLIVHTSPKLNEVIAPPPPPLPEFNNQERGFLRHGASIRKRQSKAISSHESKLDLLACIRNGIALRKVAEDKSNKVGKGHGATKGGILDVAAMLEIRRIAMQQDDDDDDDDWAEDEI